MWLTSASDLVIALTFYSLAIALLVYARRSPDIHFRWSYLMFGALLVLCATNFLLEVVTIWRDVSAPASALKAATALGAIATAVASWGALPHALALPGPAEVERRNLELVRMQADLEERVRHRTAALEDANQALRREMAERERAEAFFRLAVEASPAGKVMVDAAGKILLVNQATELVFGYARDELIGRNVEVLVPAHLRDAHPGFREKFLGEPTSRPMGAGRDLRAVRKDGSEVMVEIGLSPIATDEGTLVLASVVDVSERKRSEQALREHSERLERSNRELDEFAHVVSHDLKAPLRGIVALASWLREDCAEELAGEAREHLALLVERVHHMDGLIDGILEYSRVGRVPTDPCRVETAALVGQLIELLERPPGIRIDIEGALPDVYYDRVQLEQVFQNLIDNALQHLGRPSGVVTISGVDRGSHVEFAVRDDGVGIDPKHHERIFRMFQSLPDGSGGVGIGLAIVKRSVERHGGRIWVESAPGAGSTFRFSAPGRDAQGMAR